MNDCQIQMGMAQYKNPATPMKTRGINTRVLFNEVHKFVFAQGAQKLSAKEEM